MKDEFSFCVCTYNSAKTLNDCLRSIRDFHNGSRLLVVDHCSRDRTLEIASTFSAEIHSENKGLGFARQLCFDLVNTEFIVFVDSDVELVRDDFLRLSTSVLVNEKYGAVVGMSIGHHLSYGLPAGLLALRKRD